MFTRLEQRLASTSLSLLSAAVLAIAPATADAFVAPPVQPTMSGLAASVAADLPALDTTTDQDALIVADEDGNLYLAVYVGQNTHNGAIFYVQSPLGLKTKSELESDLLSLKIKKLEVLAALVGLDKAQNWMTSGIGPTGLTADEKGSCRIVDDLFNPVGQNIQARISLIEAVADSYNSIWYRRWIGATPLAVESFDDEHASFQSYVSSARFLSANANVIRTLNNTATVIGTVYSIGSLGWRAIIAQAGKPYAAMAAANATIASRTVSPGLHDISGQLLKTEANTIAARIANKPLKASDIKGLELTDKMTKSELDALTKSVRAEGFQNPVIEYTIIDGVPYVVRGSNRVRVARRLGKMDELVLKEVQIPFLEWKTPSEVVNASAELQLGL